VQRQRENDALSAAMTAKRAIFQGPDAEGFPRPPADTLPHVHDAFETLRQRAEDDVGSDAERQVRPSWAPPLILEGELLGACIALDLLQPDDMPIARLWAGFADPQTTGRILREQRSRHTLSGIVCRGFQLYAGSERGSTSAMLFEAQLTATTGQWRFGPRRHASDYSSPRSSEWERLVRERERLVQERERGREHQQDVPGIDARIERVAEQIAVIDAQDITAAQAHHKRQALWARAIELARERVLEFAGAPGVQMALAGRLCGHCFNCWRALTDPISLERGIGPECLDHKIEWIEATRERMDAPTLAFFTGLPEAFVIEILAKP
jgi:Family of unknown function (DUF6011)